MSFTKDQLIPGEKLIILAHQHFFVLLPAITANIAVFTVLLGASLALERLWIMVFQTVPLVYLIWEILERRQREYVLTDRRVVKQEGVFSVSSFDASLDKVNNVFHQQSFWGRVFKYGDVGLETASEQGTTIFHQVPDPVHFKNSIVREREYYKSVPASPAAGTGREDIPRLIQDLASLRDRNILTAEEFEAKKKELLDRIR
jgi:uncharacterized membrane protein YdbT with pleckstrin-like domain